jgi:hypothetical protein
LLLQVRLVQKEKRAEKRPENAATSSGTTLFHHSAEMIGKGGSRHSIAAEAGGTLKSPRKGKSKSGTYSKDVQQAGPFMNMRLPPSDTYSDPAPQPQHLLTSGPQLMPPEVGDKSDGDEGEGEATGTKGGNKKRRKSAPKEYMPQVGTANYVRNCHFNHNMK